MSNCSTGCLTQDHENYGQCMRAKGGRVAYANSATGLDYTAQKRWDRELDAYKDARRQGIQPSSTKTDAIQRALEISNATGTAYQADTSSV